MKKIMVSIVLLAGLFSLLGASESSVITASTDAPSSDSRLLTHLGRLQSLPELIKKRITHYLLDEHLQAFQVVRLN